MVRRDDVPWTEVQKLNAQGWSYRQLAEKFGVSSSAIGRRAVQECWHGTDAQRANARLRTDLVFAAVLALTLMGLSLWSAVSCLEKRLLRWKGGERSWTKTTS